MASNLNYQTYLYQAVPVPTLSSVAEIYRNLGLELSKELMNLAYDPEKVTHVYDPLNYASNLHWWFLQKYCQTEKRVLFLGMNPGPYGMAQTGVPFGNVEHVKNWMGISGTVNKPANEHPLKPIWGLNCPYKEVSGARFWGNFQWLCGTPETFFNSCFVHNYCPLMFLDVTGNNVTPEGMRVAYKRPLIEACDRTLCDIVELLKPQLIICIGRFVYARTRDLKTKAIQRMMAYLAPGVYRVKEHFPEVDVQYLMHPSGANPAANQGWEPAANKQLKDMKFMYYLNNPSFWLTSCKELFEMV